MDVISQTTFWSAFSWMKMFEFRLMVRLPTYICVTGPHSVNMMASLYGDIFRVTGPLCSEFTGHQWIPLTKASDAKLWSFFICAWTNSSVNNQNGDDLRRHRAYDVTLMISCYQLNLAPSCHMASCNLVNTGMPYYTKPLPEPMLPKH